MIPREQKISADALAKLFQDRYAAGAASSGMDDPKPWAQTDEAHQKLLVDVFGQLLGLFIDGTDPGTLWVSSIVSYRTHEGMVQIQWDAKGAQVSADDARQIARQFLEAAEAAETDSNIYRLLGGFDGAEKEIMAVNFIVAMRELREKKRSEKITENRKVAVESLAKEFMAGFTGAESLPALAMALADKAYSRGMLDSDK